MAGATVVSQDGVSHLDNALIEGDELWLTLSGLTAASGWELKPEGVCKDEICVPVTEARLHQLVRKDPSGTLFNLTEFARLIEQPVAHDAKNAAWYFGPAGWDWQSRLTSRLAPDFALPDLAGQPHTLYELRGKKIFLLFWASW